MMKNQISVFYEHIVDAARQSGLPLDAVCAKVKGFGYDSVEIDANRLFTESETILPMLEKAGLGVNCIYYFFNFGAAEDCSAADRAQAQKVIDLCGPAKCNKILVVAGLLTEAEQDRAGEAYETRRTRMARSVEQLVTMAADAGVTVVMEDFDGRETPFSTAEELMWFMQNAEGLRCGFDTGNFLYSEQDAAAVLPDFLPYIFAVHCKDRAWTKNAGDPKITVKNRAMYPVAVGDGDLDIAGMVKKILDSGYTGVFAAEHFGSAEQLRDMERSAKFLRDLLEKYEA